MMLLEEDVTRLVAEGYSRDFFTVESDGWIFLRNFDGRCVFLSAGECRVYSHRPVGCLLYPLVYSEIENAVVVDDTCRFFEGKISKREIAAVKSVVKRLILERKQRIKNTKNKN